MEDKVAKLIFDKPFQWFEKLPLWVKVPIIVVQVIISIASAVVLLCIAIGELD